MTDMTPLPPGWYPDPTDPTRERWWSGQEWDAGTPPRPVAPPAASRRLNAYMLTVLIVVVAVAVVAIIVGRNGGPG